MSNGEVLETFIERDSAGGNGTTLVARRPDGSCVAVFVRAPEPGENAPGLVEGSRYADYLVVWDKDYSNLLGVEADSEAGSSLRRVVVTMKADKHGSIGVVRLSNTEQPPADASDKPDKELLRIREKAPRLSARFLESVRALSLITEGSGDLSSPAFPLLGRFAPLPGDLRIDSRKPLDGEVPEGVRAFLTSSPVPTKDQTGWGGGN